MYVWQFSGNSWSLLCTLSSFLSPGLYLCSALWTTRRIFAGLFPSHHLHLIASEAFLGHSFQNTPLSRFIPFRICSAQHSPWSGTNTICLLDQCPSPFQEQKRLQCGSLWVLSITASSVSQNRTSHLVSTQHMHDEETQGSREAEREGASLRLENPEQCSENVCVSVCIHA